MFCIRDFDEKGFEIARTLREDTRRYAWSGEGAIDLGLRLEDVERYDLESEPVHYTARAGSSYDSSGRSVAKIGDRARKEPAPLTRRSLSSCTGASNSTPSPPTN